jgi:hypothetical protein
MNEKSEEIKDIVELQINDLIKNFTESLNRMSGSNFNLSEIDKLTMSTCNKFSNIIMNLLLQLRTIDE